MQQERQAQLEEQARRKEIAAALKKKGEEEMTVRIALELKRQMQVSRWQMPSQICWAALSGHSCTRNMAHQGA